MLFAIEHTALHARLEREGCLLPDDSTTVQVHGSADLNSVPKQMTIEEVRRGYNWIIRALYRYDPYKERPLRAMRPSKPSPAATQRSVRRLSGRHIAMSARILAYFLVTQGRARRRFFQRTFWEVMRERPSMQKLVVTLSFMTVHKHFHEYVYRTHGDAETAGCLLPFADAATRLRGSEDSDPWGTDRRGVHGAILRSGGRSGRRCA